MIPPQKLRANPAVVLREEFDDWAILFDPDTGNAFSINPTGVLVWKYLCDAYDIDGILDKLKETLADVPCDVEEHVRAFIQHITDLGLAGDVGEDG